MPLNKVGDPLFTTRKVRILDQTVFNVSLKIGTQKPQILGMSIEYSIRLLSSSLQGTQWKVHFLDESKGNLKP